MNNQTTSPHAFSSIREFLSRGWGIQLRAVSLGLLVSLTSLPVSSAVPVAQSPLFLPQGVPGNLILTPSVEWPTINVAAYANGFTTAGVNYSGLFDPRFCYRYIYDATEANRYFDPVANADASGACSTANYWSGKFLNWATTQAIEPFRIALTGGNRVKDDATETWIQKARQDGQGGTGQFPDRNLTDGAVVKAYSPAVNWDELQIRITGLQDKLRFTYSAPNWNTGLVDYDPTTHALTSNAADKGRVYELSVRVRVCKAGFLAANCVAYGSNYKPEGLIQGYSTQLRYGVFGYLNDSSMLRDGAVLRARQKYVGPLKYPPLVAPSSNSLAEWDAATGIIYKNPNPADATDTGLGVDQSGVINYINKFGERLGASHKSFDPVSEMYYAALRYIRHIGNIPAYSSDYNAAMADGFPVITSWDDPVQYKCQANVILGIGDVYTHRDKNLPGATSSLDEPAKPTEVTNDTVVDVISLTNKVAAMEGVNIPTGDNFSGRNNSAFIAGLAYDAHVRDQRPDVGMEGSQTVSTYWVDVRESNTVVGRAQNQYYLAAKYGGFRVPAGYDPATRVTALEENLWYNSGETLESGDKRPDNFFVASNPDAMIAALKNAFAKISADIQLGSGASLGATSTRLEAGAAIFQASFRSGEWSGDLASYPIAPSTGNIGAESWRASVKLADRAAALANWWDANSPGTRKVYMSQGTTRQDFTYANVSSQYSAVGLSQKAVDYLRGDRSNEAYSPGNLRPRGSVLGSIVNSQPLYVDSTTTYPTRKKMVYVGANDGMLHAFDAATGEEVFAYVPKAAITDTLKKYTEYSVTGYEHKYMVDGELTASTVNVGGIEKTYLVGTMGRGNPGIFALDVTNPDNVAVLWDKTGGASGSDIPALGNNLGKPVIAQVASGNWQVVLGNGPNSATGAGALIMVTLPGGTVKTASVGGTNNALTAPVVWRSTNGGYFDTAYAGDLLGKLWKITNLSASSPATATLYTTPSQPITAAPLVAINPTSLETWVFFGTGKFLSSADIGDVSKQTWYGITDGATFSGTTLLVKREILAESEVGSTGIIARSISASGKGEMAGKRGWYMELIPPSGVAAGERMVVPNTFQGLALIGTTRIPIATDPCGSGSKGFVMAIDPFTGGRFGSNSSNYFDINGDGVLDDNDGLTSGNTTLPNSGIGLDAAGAGVIGIGDKLYTSLDTGGRARLSTLKASGFVNRVSWREILLNMRTTP